MQLGVYTFGELTPDPSSGATMPAERRMKDLLEEIELADQVGLDVFGVGEHHREEFIISAPAIVLAAAAARTENIRLTSAVSIISSDDPVRVFQEFATLDLISGGRAEIMAGRGSFIESFPLFGYDLRDYSDLFVEKLDLLLELTHNPTVSWSGKFRPAIDNISVYPRPVQDPLPVWIAVGGTPESVIRAGSKTLPLALAIIGGLPERFSPIIELYRESAQLAGHDVAKLPVSINAHGLICDDGATAKKDLFPYYQFLMNRIARERGFAPIDKASYDAMCDPRGHLLVGDPEQVAEKILFQHEFFRNDRYLIQFSTGTMPHKQIMRSIELLGTEVAPIVKKEVARRAAKT